MKGTAGKAYFCPRCHSPAVSFTQLEGVSDSPASCSACHWRGGKKDLVVTAYQHDMGSEDEVLTRFVRDFRNLMGQPAIALPIAQWLNKWGFLPNDPSQQHKVLARYITAVAKGAITAVLQTREELEKDRVNVS